MIEVESRPEPIHSSSYNLAEQLIDKPVLFASRKEGLGFYGVLKGFSEDTKLFIVKADFNNKEYKCEWIVEYLI